MARGCTAPNIGTLQKHNSATRAHNLTGLTVEQTNRLLPPDFSKDRRWVLQWLDCTEPLCATNLLEGRIVLGEESHLFREKVRSPPAAGKRKIVLDRANVTYIAPMRSMLLIRSRCVSFFSSSL